MENIYLISNPYTIPKNFEQKYPLSYNYYKFQKSLETRGLTLIFVNQDKNHVYFKVRNIKTNKTTRVIGTSYTELKNFSVSRYYREIMEELKDGI